MTKQGNASLAVVLVAQADLKLRIMEFHMPFQVRRALRLIPTTTISRKPYILLHFVFQNMG